MKKIPVWKNIVLILSVLVVIMIATFAWFYTRTWGEVADIPVHVGDASYILVSGDQGENWSEDLIVDFGVAKNIKEISGNGVNFFAPNYQNIQKDDGSFATEIVGFSPANNSGKYFEQVLELRSDAAQKILLSPESFVQAVGNEENNFIDGAIRVAFFEVDDQGSETLKCIWAPNSAVEYSDETDSFTREGYVEPYYYYQKSVNPVDPGSLGNISGNADIAVISTENTDEFGCGYNATHKFLWSNGENMPTNAPVLVNMDTASEDQMYYQKLKIKVWIEGYDRECVSLLSGQRFTMLLHFAAQEGE